MNKQKRTILIIVVVAAIVVFGVWTRMLRYVSMDAAIADGRTSIPWIQQLDTHFKGARHSISHYNGVLGSPVWNSQVGLFDRYVLTARVPISIGWSGRSVRATGDPVFGLAEVSSIEFLNDGRIMTSYNGLNSALFGKDAWTRIIESGSFKGTGVQVDQASAPVPGFDAASAANAF